MNDDVDKIIARFRNTLPPALRRFGPVTQKERIAALAYSSDSLATLHRSVTGTELPSMDEEETAATKMEPVDAVYLPPEGELAARTTHTLVISDIHLGSPVCRAHDLRRVMRSWSFQRLVILGDLFDNLKFFRLQKHHWKLLGDFRKHCGADANVAELIWVKGNHDDGAIDLIAKMIGAHVVEDTSPYAFELGGRRVGMFHGHQFDDWVSEYPVKTHLASAFYLMVQQFDKIRSKPLSRWLKRQSKELVRNSEKVAAGARDYAQRHKLDIVICGHTHLATRENTDGIAYLNTGCWTETPATLVAVDEKGARLVEYY